MSKVMIVEDDDSLREIYGIRLTAEGYAVVSAHDGEEALAVAVRERPDLIISDVMMPKITGFDMLDILRSTPETQNIKVIMMTALSSEDQRVRGENLGADRYLVKSQVGIEDVVNVVHEVLGDRNASGVINPAANAPVAPATQIVAPTIPQSAPTIPSVPVQPQAAAPIGMSTQPEPVAPMTAPTVTPGVTSMSNAPQPFTQPQAPASTIPPQVIPPVQ